MRQIVTNGIVLRRINYSEADRVVTFLTPDHGKLVVLARGVRKSNSKLAGSIELFGTSQITFLGGKSSMSTLISARLIKDYRNIVKDFNKTQLTYNILKLINKTIEDGAGGEFYELLEQAYEAINNEVVDLEVVRAWFGLRFLDLMGNSPSTDLSELKKTTKNSFNFDFEKMIFVESDTGLFNQKHVKLFLLNFNHTPIQLMRIENVSKINEKIGSLVDSLVVEAGFDKI